MQAAKGGVTLKDCGRHDSSRRGIFFKWFATHDDCECHCRDCEPPPRPFIIFLMVLVAFLLILLAVVILVIFLVLHPHKPRFYLQSATVRQLNLSDGFLTSNLQFTVVSHNPNDRVGVLYDSLRTYASYLGQQITPQYPLPPFYQDDQDLNVLTPLLCGNSIPLAPVVCQQLNYDRQNGLLSLSLRIEGTIRWKVGTWTSGHYHLNANCWAILGLSNDGIGDQVPLQPGTRCHLEV